MATLFQLKGELKSKSGESWVHYDRDVFRTSAEAKANEERFLHYIYILWGPDNTVENISVYELTLHESK